MSEPKNYLPIEDYSGRGLNSAIETAKNVTQDYDGIRFSAGIECVIERITTRTLNEIRDLPEDKQIEKLGSMLCWVLFIGGLMERESSIDHEMTSEATGMSQFVQRGRARSKVLFPQQSVFWRTQRTESNVRIRVDESVTAHREPERNPRAILTSVCIQRGLRRPDSQTGQA